jgi:hypothetical protein
MSSRYICIFDSPQGIMNVVGLAALFPLSLWISMLKIPVPAEPEIPPPVAIT